MIKVQLLNICILASSFLMLFLVADFLHQFLKLKIAYIRRFVHLVTSLLTFLMPMLVYNHWFVLGLSLFFTYILYISKKKQYLKSINTIERPTHGTLFYPLAIYACYFCFDYFGESLYYMVPLLLLALADPLATWVGKRWPWGKYSTHTHSKSLAGSLAFFLCSLAISMAMIMLEVRFTIVWTIATSVTIAFATTWVEARSHQGLDNVTVPAVTLIILLISIHFFV